MVEKIVIQVSPEEVERKQLWFKELANFLVEANSQTWAADKGKVEPTRSGNKRHIYLRGDWRFDDEYDSYFKAPGATKVFYKEVPVWSMHYGGVGMTKDYEHMAKETYAFLRSALLKATPEFPYRGPDDYWEGNKNYKFRLTMGNIEDCSWVEEIRQQGILLFKQIGFAGISVDKDQNRQPVYPWNL